MTYFEQWLHTRMPSCSTGMSSPTLQCLHTSVWNMKSFTFIKDWSVLERNFFTLLIFKHVNSFTRSLSPSILKNEFNNFVLVFPLDISFLFFLYSYFKSILIFLAKLHYLSILLWAIKRFFSKYTSFFPYINFPPSNYYRKYLNRTVIFKENIYIWYFIDIFNEIIIFYDIIVIVY